MVIAIIIRERFWGFRVVLAKDGGLGGVWVGDG